MHRGRYAGIGVRPTALVFALLWVLVSYGPNQDERHPRKVTIHGIVQKVVSKKCSELKTAPLARVPLTIIDRADKQLALVRLRQAQTDKHAQWRLADSSGSFSTKT